MSLNVTCGKTAPSKALQAIHLNTHDKKPDKTGHTGHILTKNDKQLKISNISGTHSRYYKLFTKL